MNHMRYEEKRTRLLVKRRAIVGFILILVIAFSALVIVSASKRFLYFEELNETTILLANQPFTSIYVGNFTDANNNTIARIQLIFENLTTQSYYEAKLIIHHAENIEVDSMAVKLKSPDFLNVYLKSDPSNVQYSFERKIGRIIFKVEDFRWLGKVDGDADFHFLLRAHPDPPYDLQVSIDLHLHRVAPIQLAGIHAHKVVDMTFPIGKTAE